MESITVKAYAKINLSLDITGNLPGGFHKLSSVMQGIGLHDILKISWNKDIAEEIDLKLAGKKKRREPNLPIDGSNLAMKAAMIMRARYGKEAYGGKLGGIRIELDKKIPVAAGLAGGSSDGAAVIMALNRLWNLNLTWEELCKAGETLGSDVPFCMWVQGAMDRGLLGKMVGREQVNLSTCALATGRGIELMPAPARRFFVVLSKPDIGVSTKEAYEGYDRCLAKGEVPRPGTKGLLKVIKSGKLGEIKNNMVNALELYTLKRYHEVACTKNKMLELCGESPVLMSGSGPTVFCLAEEEREAKKVYDVLKVINEDTFITKTLI